MITFEHHQPCAECGKETTCLIEISARYTCGIAFIGDLDSSEGRGRLSREIYLCATHAPDDARFGAQPRDCKRVRFFWEIPQYILSESALWLVSLKEKQQKDARSRIEQLTHGA